jgi:glycosyltransferase involved in cell wall biosynthesis
VESRIRGFDLAFFPWPFFISPPRLDCPTVGIFHDLNFKYYFSGSDTFSPSQRAQLESETAQWLKTAMAVVSTDFMASELRHFYPHALYDIRRVYLPPLSGTEPMATEKADLILSGLGIRSPYTLCPTHMCSHKNIGPLIAAQARLTAQGRDLVLVLTGSGTDAVTGRATEIGVRLDRTGGDVIGLGYVSNEQINALVQRAAVVVNPSLYEAGNGPGLDAFGLGTPVAMSNIPAFAEHVEKQGMHAAIFDPRSPADIAEKIAAVLDNPRKARDDAHRNLTALARLTWERSASEYLSIFRDAVTKATQVV